MGVDAAAAFATGRTTRRAASSIGSTTTGGWEGGEGGLTPVDAEEEDSATAEPACLFGLSRLVRLADTDLDALRECALRRLAASFAC